MSTRDWPPGWGKHHEAFCVFTAIRTRLIPQRENNVVELRQQMRNSAEQERILGTVPIDIDDKTLAVVARAMIESYERGFADGQSSLAAAIQAPITLALQKEL